MTDLRKRVRKLVDDFDPEVDLSEDLADGILALIGQGEAAWFVALSDGTPKREPGWTGWYDTAEAAQADIDEFEIEGAYPRAVYAHAPPSSDGGYAKLSVAEAESLRAMGLNPDDVLISEAQARQGNYVLAGDFFKELLAKTGAPPSSEPSLREAVRLVASRLCWTHPRVGPDFITKVQASDDLFAALQGEENG